MNVIRRASTEVGQPEFVDLRNLALALVNEGSGSHYQVWERIRFDISELKNLLEKLGGKLDEKTSVRGEAVISEGFSRLIEVAQAEANSLNHSWVGTEHVLLAFGRKLPRRLLSDREIQTLTTLQGSYSKVRGAVLEMYQNIGVKEDDAFEFKPDPNEAGFRVFIDPGSAKPEEIAEVFEAISELNRAVGGHGMIFLDCLEQSKTPAGAQR